MKADRRKGCRAAYGALRHWVERSTGARDLDSVPEHRIVNALTELICCFSLVGEATKKPANIEEALADIRERAFAKMRGEKV
jgi:hypothetical protein